MSDLTTVTISVMDADHLFPASDDDGRGVVPTQQAVEMVAAEVKGVTANDIKWHAPDIFSVRYGSSYVATAVIFKEGKRVHAVRFVCDESEFWEGDDRGVELVV